MSGFKTVTVNMGSDRFGNVLASVQRRRVFTEMLSAEDCLPLLQGQSHPSLNCMAACPCQIKQITASVFALHYTTFIKHAFIQSDLHTNTRDIYH